MEIKKTFAEHGVTEDIPEALKNISIGFARTDWIDHPRFLIKIIQMMIEQPAPEIPAYILKSS